MIGGVETVTRLRAAVEYDRNGNEVPGAVAEVDIAGCYVAGNSSSEPDQVGRTAVVTGLMVYLPAGVDVLPSDQFRVRGGVYEVEGLPFDWQRSRPNLLGHAGVVVSLKGVSG